MQAFRPDGAGSVVLDGVDEPQPDPGEALIEVSAYSVNRGETLLLERPRPGWRPGKDVAGRVLQAAANGSGPPVGARAVGHPPMGGWAERVAVPTTALVALPDHLPATTAAALPLAGLTAVRLLRACGSLLGRRVLITAASGGVGHYVTELAVAAGADVTAVAASSSRGARLAEFGATVVADPADAPGRYDVASSPSAVAGSRPLGARPGRTAS